MVRQNPNGSNDTTFNFSGTVNTRTYPNFRSTATSLAIQADGKIVVAGHDGPHDGSTRDFAVVRYNPNGSLDTSFDGDGIARVGFVGYSKDYATGVKIQSDGKIVLAGYSDVGLLVSNDIAVARLNTTGSLDNTFGTGGRVTTSVGFKTEDIVNSLVIQADGKIVVAGKTRNSLVYYNEDAMLVRYNTNGSLDSSFGISGVVTTEFKSGNNDGFKTVTIQNGRILAAGYTTADTSPDFYSNVFSVTLARYYQ